MFYAALLLLLFLMLNYSLHLEVEINIVFCKWCVWLFFVVRNDLGNSNSFKKKLFFSGKGEAYGPKNIHKLFPLPIRNGLCIYFEIG